MANLRKIGGNYYAYFHDRSRSPTRKSYPLRVHLKSTAEKELKRLEKAKAEGRFDPWRDDPWIGETDVEPIAVGNAVDEFLEAKSKRCRPETVDTYEQQLRAWEKTLPATVQIVDLKVRDVEPYVYDSGTSNATKRKRYRHLRVFLNWCRDNGYLDEEHPIDKLGKPREQTKEKPILRPEDVDNLLDEIEEHHKTTTDVTGRKPDVQWLKEAIVIAMYTGLRRRELVHVWWKDVDLDQEALTVRNREGFRTKTGDERIVPLRGPALSRVRKMYRRKDPAQDEPVITDRNGDAVRPNRLTRRFSNFANMAGLDERVSFHSLRHSCATLLLSRNVPVRIVQEILGHENIQTTEIYAHVLGDTMGDEMEKAFGGGE